MCIGVFIQLNEGSKYAQKWPIGYVIQESGCWDWVGRISGGGYGRLRWNGRPGYSAHRMMYELHKGPIPAHLEIDHLCRNRRCVNPDHLEAVTSHENTLRGLAPTVHRNKTVKTTRAQRDEALIGLANGDSRKFWAERLGVSTKSVERWLHPERRRKSR